MILISDLDRTLIYSKKSFINNYNGDYVCVEKSGDKEITFVATSALPLIDKLFKTVPLIPCTMRSFAQTMRVNFIRETGINTCICTNGAEIYIEGEKDMDWDYRISSYIDEKKFLTNIDILKERFADFDVQVRNILGYYLEIRCKDDSSAIEISEIAKTVITDENLSIFPNTNKVFLIDKRINKESAVLYLKNKLNLKDIICSGDANVDLGMLVVSDYSIAPAHKTFDGNFNYVTKSTGILAGEEILKHILEYSKVKGDN